jgi:hypothetical protein
METPQAVAPRHRPAARRFRRRLALTMLAYMAVLLPVGWMAHHHVQPPAPWLYLVGVAPALPILAAIWVILRYLTEEDDEYLRMLQVRTFVVATGLTLAITSAWGFLQAYAGLPMIPLFYVFVIFALSQLVAGPLVMRTLWTAR